jgi:hypothetical protein
MNFLLSTAPYGNAFQPELIAKEMRSQNTAYLPHALHNRPKILSLYVRINTSIYRMITALRYQNKS